MIILFADDHALYRESVKQWLCTTESNREIITVSNLTDVIHYLKNNRPPSLLMLDLCMPGMNGVSNICEVHQGWPDVPILIVSARNDPSLIKKCIEAGAAGFLSKTASGEHMLEAIDQLLAGRCFIPQDIFRSLNLKLSKKQESILPLLAEGHCNREIAKRTHLSEGTIKQYVSDILSKLDVNNRVQAGIRARQILGLE